MTNPTAAHAKAKKPPGEGRKPARARDAGVDALARLSLLRDALKAADGAPAIFNADAKLESSPRQENLSRRRAMDIAYLRRPRSPSAEAYRALRARLLTACDPERTRLFAIAAHGGGKEAAACALNLAAAFAELGRRTLVVDADFRRPRLALPTAGVEGGLRALIAGAEIEQVASSGGVDRLSFLSTGASGPDATALLADGGLTEALRRCKSAFDHTIVIAPPFGPSADAHFVWAACSSVVVVARRHRDRAAGLKEMATALRQVGAVAIAGVLAG